jgi:hypothetical protein
MKDPNRKADIDYLRILAQRYQTVPAWKDLALACNEILGEEVDARRRRLERIRDSVKYRKGDTLTNFEYRPQVNKPAILEQTRQPVDIPIGYVVKSGNIKNVIRNIVYYENSDGTDYLDLSFEYKGDVCRWLKPVNITQERDALLKNSYIMGFDFFNTKLNDEDLQRVYEYIQAYWPESGSDDNFMKFIGFIKNIKFGLVALWTEDNAEYPSDDPNTEYPYLEPFNKETMVSVKDGGSNWETSHVQIEYDLAQFKKFYTVNLDDLEQLFYYFAPIILVLERITGTLEVETNVLGINAVELTSFNYDVLKPPDTFITDILGVNALELTSFNYDILKTPDTFITDVLGITAYELTSFNYGRVNTNRTGCLGLDYRVDLRQTCFDFQPYLACAGII